jgi:arylsulfatase A-like enzyme
MIGNKLPISSLGMGILIPSLLAASCINRSQDQNNNSKKPNVLLIVSDDQGYGDFGIYDGVNDVHTPHLDKLAENGTRFTNAYVTMSVCSPSRWAIRHHRWKLRYLGQSKKLRLYNLEKDIDETNDLSENYPQKVDSLRSKFFTWYENTIPEKHQKKFEQ